MSEKSIVGQGSILKRLNYSYLVYLFLVPWAALIGYFIFPLKADFSVYVKRVLDVWPLIILCIVWTLIMVLAIHHDLKLRKKYGGDP